MSYFIYTDLITSLLDPSLVDPGSTLIHVGAHSPKNKNIVRMEFATYRSVQI